MNAKDALTRIDGEVYSGIPNIFFKEIPYGGRWSSLTMLYILDSFVRCITVSMEKYRHE